MYAIPSYYESKEIIMKLTYNEKRSIENDMVNVINRNPKGINTRTLISQVLNNVSASVPNANRHHVSGMIAWVIDAVITSYSIHYTKLYDIVTHSTDALVGDYRNLIRFYKNGDKTSVISGYDLRPIEHTNNDGRIKTEDEKHLIMHFPEIKEAFYAKSAILIEGETEYGCIHAFSDKSYNFV